MGRIKSHPGQLLKAELTGRGISPNQLAFDRPLDQWLDAVTSMEGLRLWELTPPILLQSCQLPQPFHGDPADQIIVATARHHDGAVLVTKDGPIRRSEHVSSTW